MSEIEIKWKNSIRRIKNEYNSIFNKSAGVLWRFNVKIKGELLQGEVLRLRRRLG